MSGNRLIIESYKSWVGGQPCADIHDYSHQNANRGTVELMLLCQALVAGGSQRPLRLVEAPNYGRALAEAVTGQVHIPAETIWDQEIDEHNFYISDPIIRHGEYEKAIYTRKNHREVLSVKTLDDLRRFTAVLPATWNIDREVLISSGFRMVYASSKENALRMLLGGRADFFLLEFSHSNRVSRDPNVNNRLAIVPDFKVSLPGARYFVVSQRAPGASEVYRALNKGVKLLRQNGVIERAYREAGFLIQRR